MTQPDRSSPTPSICFVAPNAFGVIAGRRDLHIGGAEVQQHIIARGLAENGYRVSFVTEDHGQQDADRWNRIRVYNAYRRDAGVPGVRFLHPRITGLWRAMARADADVYYQRTSDSTTGVVGAFCRRHHRKFIFAAAALEDCMTDLPRCTTHRERVLYLHGLRRAHRVTAQTVTQQRMFLVNFGVDAVVVPSCAPDPGPPAPAQHGPPRRLIWVGRFTPLKRLHMLLDVASRCHDVTFDVVGDGDDDDYVRGLKAAAARLPNVHMHGRTPRDRVTALYRAAAAVVCTSAIEGFPNTFLEAWSLGRPALSTFDPDAVIADYGLGVVAADADGLAAGARALVDDAAAWRDMSARVRRHFEERHTIAAVLPQHERLLNGLWDVPRARRAAPVGAACS